MAAQGANYLAEFEVFVAEQVASGRYGDAQEVLYAAKAALNLAQVEDDLDYAYVNQAVREGMASGVAEGDVFADLRERFHLPPRP